ncbi:MAG: bifunctional glutamate N-acetyltransferase/amino-acid acetyltransferase ArgJ [Armatimonadota bacterium]|nr:bifunctional glutamate N-acetyltransferase/amino-acid acetyltransferase ArgJ [Armatimonadota bacterium]MDR7437109.1 bifunctional glutamate N-acetyltransferase/amino-acid acetyltransferase ArgJ [Armatimonadota bacterium]MDR7472454.1 bifunctional glutamate N-acetyltransferase/amino-acid acetyltransferase ArgJ [Armatimonadota bacterium]MDR7506641.1 bifunctional glutamate N-acetyltransferase/amino-acid acetyltransferase ArgJ [Armatimonadota bacterium]MDR7509199.1 bifunctional glutamate N-acetylt
MAVHASVVSLQAGGVTSPRGFLASGVHCGIKASRPDLALVVCERPATAAAVFTTNRVKAAPVLLSQQRIRSGRARAVVINSGNANACTGPRGLADAREMAALVAAGLGASEEEVLVASTGVIGVPLPMEALRRGIPQAVRALRPDGGDDAARAILTTDAFPKTAAARVEVGGVAVTVGGMAKGAGMIHPRMATTLGVITTDAAVTPPALQRALREAADGSFNRISVDGDTSTNDSLFCLASGMAGNPPLDEDSEGLAAFQAALDAVARELALMVVRDGEGTGRIGRLVVRGARSADDARRVAEAVMTSPLVKTALAGPEPNWGRIVAAAGRSGAEVDPDRFDVWIAGHLVARGGAAAGADLDAVAADMRRPEVEIVVDLRLGHGAWSGWFSDLTEAYVKTNAGYMS